MANILEFLRTVLVDEGAQRSFRHDPSGYLKEGGFGDLTGEDVAEAMNVLRRSLPDPVAAGLAPFAAPDGTEGIPPFRPVGVESELDAAARILGYAIDECPAPMTVPATSWAPPSPPPAMADEPGVDAEVATEWAPVAEPDPVPSWDASPPPPPPTAVYDADAEGEGDRDPAADDAPSIGSEPAPLIDAAPSFLSGAETDPDLAETTGWDPPAAGADGPSFGAALDAAILDARSRHEEAIRQYTDTSGRTTRELGERLDALVQEAQVRAGDITSAAQASVTQLHEEAEAARRQGEEEARTIVEQARREADEIRAAAHAEVETSRQDIETRRAALLDAEEQLKEKFSGIDALFRQVLHDDQPSEAGEQPGEHQQ